MHIKMHRRSQFSLIFLWLFLLSGCGSGRYLHINKNLYKLGSDFCPELVEIASQAGHNGMVCDNLRLPYRDSCFDAVISIGVIHHFTTPKRRAAAVCELARILRPGGKLMIYVWAMEQKHRKVHHPIPYAYTTNSVTWLSSYICLMLPVNCVLLPWHDVLDTCLRGAWQSFDEYYQAVAKHVNCLTIAWPLLVRWADAWQVTWPANTMYMPSEKVYGKEWNFK